MKKFFFFRSSVNGGNGKNNLISQSKNDSQTYWEHPLEEGTSTSVGDKAGGSPCNSKLRSSKSGQLRNVVERSSTGPKLRRSRSLSSAASASGSQGRMNSSVLNDASGCPCDFSTVSKHHAHSTRCQSSTPERERQYSLKQVEMPNSHCTFGAGRPCSAATSRTYHDSSVNSPTSSSNVSNRVLDRFIDGEQQLEVSSSKNKYPHRNNGWRPPRARCLANSSPTASIKEKPKFHSFRESKHSHFRSLSGEWEEGGFGDESPRSLAKNVVERLSQCHIASNATSEPDHDSPIKTTDIYSRSLNGYFDPNSNMESEACFPTDEPSETVGDCHPKGFSSFLKQNISPGLISEGCKFGATYEDLNLDGELQKSAKEAEERIMFLSEELEQEHFVQYRKFDASDLTQIIKRLTEERFTLALEIASIIQSRIAERASAKEVLRMANAELDSSTQKLEREKNELQLGLEKELDRRSSDWSCKLEKYQIEENRLRERVRELAEQNVLLQREVSSLNEREAKKLSTIANFEQNIEDMTRRIDEKNGQNKHLQLNISKLEEDCREAKRARDCIKKGFEDKEEECRELHRTITRLLRTCSEQEKTIGSLRERFSEQFGKNQPVEKLDKQVEKLRMEQMRLIGVELALRKESESYRVEVDSLRRENINLLTRLKDNHKENGAITFKLDSEMGNHIYHLQNKGLALLNDSTQFCSKLLESIKEKPLQLQEAKHGTEHFKDVLHGQFVVESEMKVQGFKHGIESLTRSLHKASTLLHEKSNPTSFQIQSQSSDIDRALQLNNGYSEDVSVLRSELKAETLLTNLLRDQLYSKELEVEQLQAELVAAVRGNDMLKCEVQNGIDNLSRLTHKLKDLELQLLKKNDDVIKFENSIGESTKELETLKDILPKISKERDMMWDEVNKQREKNMLLNSEVDAFKTKIDTLEEDILLKEGQITILKDTIGRKSVDLLSSPGSAWRYRV